MIAILKRALIRIFGPTEPPEITDVYRAGYAGYDAGEDNPYPRNDPKYKEWQLGFEHADNDWARAW